MARCWRPFFLHFVVAGLTVLSGCVSAQSDSGLQRRLDGLVGQNIAAAVAELGPEDRNGANTHTNIGTPQAPIIPHQWSQFGSTQHTRFVQTGIDYSGQWSNQVAPGPNGMVITPTYEPTYNPTGYYQQQGESCYLTIYTNGRDIITHYDTTGGYCDKLFSKG
ncbi:MULTISPECIES: hypothetical protein [unclassified Rhizobium]|uniref:hypothetical protein n=1 Tax=unclassified Rhizobium TaxID=2613769 RepID=UPI0006488F57|nr:MULTISPECIES: hypothetical protein [unclassified Rhizobium]OJY77677.1 MAG: hypothetical protein BGP09_28960 [Rhizobium sp. 60-20]RKD35619.1 hypothetical protein BJ928_1378 [Rhizobium sp. WW_1]